MKQKKKRTINGMCVKCWNADKTPLCKRGFPQNENRPNCRWFSGIKEVK